MNVWTSCCLSAWQLRPQARNGQSITHGRIVTLSHPSRLNRRALTENAHGYRMIKRGAKAAGIKAKIGNHTLCATRTTAYLKNGGKLETRAGPLRPLLGTVQNADNLDRLLSCAVNNHEGNRQPRVHGYPACVLRGYGEACLSRRRQSHRSQSRRDALALLQIAFPCSRKYG